MVRTVMLLELYTYNAIIFHQSLCSGKVQAPGDLGYNPIHTYLGVTPLTVMGILRSK